MVLAARAMAAGNKAISVNVNGKAYAGAYEARLSGEEIRDTPLTIVNNGSDPVDAVVTTIAAPVQPLSAGGTGFEINRSYYTLDGQPVSVSSVQQNERYLVVLQMREANAWPSRVVVTDLLPAGFVIDNPRLIGSASSATSPGSARYPQVTRSSGATASWRRLTGVAHPTAILWQPTSFAR